MANISHLVADHIPKIDPPEVQLRDAMISAGITPPASFSFDGQLHRYDDQKENGDALWYVAFDSAIPGCCFGSFRTGDHINWRGQTGRTYTMVEEMAFKAAIEEAKRKAATEKQIKQELAADDSAKIWDGLTLATGQHPYLTRKGVQPHMARVDGRGALVVPMTDLEGEMMSLQTIFQDGKKLFHKGGKTVGAMLQFGSKGPKVYLAEGFATAATIYEETGIWTVATFSAQNLVPVAESLRASDTTLEIVVIADNDKSGTGQNYANQVAAKYGATVIVSPVESDVNDYRQQGGDIKALLSPQPITPWLIDGDTFTEQPAPIRWMVKKWLQADSLIMVHGPSGSGKTFVVLDWCLSLVAGFDDWRGFKLRPCPVVYLAGEGHHGIKGRMAAWRAFHGFTGSLRNISVSRSGCDLNTPGGLQQVISSIRGLPETPGLVVVDTLHRFLSGDENSAQDAKTMLDACAVIQQEFKCSVLLVHHTGVNEEAQHRARGSSAWRGALDIEISIQPGAPGIPLSIIQKKSKDAELAEKLFGELQSVVIPGWVDEDGEPVTSAVLIAGDEPRKRTTKAEESAKDSIVKAWQESGEEMVDGFPFVTRSAWKGSMVRDDVKETTAAQYVKPTVQKGFAGRLVELGLIDEDGSGFKILFPVISRNFGK